MWIEILPSLLCAPAKLPSANPKLIHVIPFSNARSVANSVAISLGSLRGISPARNLSVSEKRIRSQGSKRLSICSATESRDALIWPRANSCTAEFVALNITHVTTADFATIKVTMMAIMMERKDMKLACHRRFGAVLAGQNRINGLKIYCRRSVFQGDLGGIARRRRVWRRRKSRRGEPEVKRTVS